MTTDIDRIREAPQFVPEGAHEEHVREREIHRAWAWLRGTV
jgi:hypothetical protein